MRFEPPEGVDAESFRTYQALKRMTVMHRHLMMKAFAVKGTHPGQAMCLFVLGKHSGLSQRDLAEYLHVSAPSVTGMLQKMERAGLVERTTDPDDQRLTRISITEAGMALLGELHGVFGQEVNTMFEGMSDNDRAELARLLDIVNDNIARSLSAAHSTTEEA
ncbi:MAG: MarR family transcriptional regulator [Coriobacteriia bacterium]